MTSRTTPVGIFVIALAGLLAAGCSAQTTAVFDALRDSARTPASASGDVTTGEAAQGSGSGSWWPHLDDGYAMDLPAGWFGASLDRSDANRLIDAVSASMPRLAQRMTAVLDDTGSRVSGIAGDPSAGSSGPVMLVLAQPRGGRGKHEMKLFVKRQISQLPELQAGPFLKDAGLSSVRGWRIDYSINDADLGALRVRSYLTNYGPDAFLVSFIAPEGSVDDLDGLFDTIADSLHFGV